MERGFIAAEVGNWEDVVAAGSWAKAKEVAKIRLEGRGYTVEDGDTLIVRFKRLGGTTVPPFRRPEKPLSESRLALVTTGGVHLPDDTRFRHRRSGPATAPTARYQPPLKYSPGPTPTMPPAARETWIRYFPLWTLRDLVEEGVVGELNERHFSFMGAIHDATPLVEKTAPEVAGKLAADGVDAVLLTPS